MRSHSLVSEDGIRLRAETCGKGPSMLLCNGLFCTTQYYVPWLAHFQKSYHLVQFDYRSHGGSDDDPNPSNVSMDSLVDDASSVMNKLCDNKTIVVGHSMGVRVALGLYDRYPNRISCLILLCGSAFDSLGEISSKWPVSNAVLSVLWLGDRITPLAKIVKNLTVRFDLITKVGVPLGGLSKQTPKEAINGLLSNVDRLDVRMMTTLARSYIHHSNRRLLPLVNVPTLYLVGEKDRLATPSHADKVVQMMPQAQKYVVKGCTHLALVEKPEEIHKTVEDFLLSALDRRVDVIN